MSRISIELSEKQLKNIAKLSQEDQITISKIMSSGSISFKNAKKELKKAKKDYSGVSISDIKCDLICDDFRKLEDTFVSKFGQVDIIKAICKHYPSCQYCIICKERIS